MTDRDDKPTAPGSVLHLDQLTRAEIDLLAFMLGTLERGELVAVVGDADMRVVARLRLKIDTLRAGKALLAKEGA